MADLFGPVTMMSSTYIRMKMVEAWVPQRNKYLSTYDPTKSRPVNDPSRAELR